MTTFAVDDLAIAKSALRDGLWYVARTHAEAVDSDESRLIVLESLAAEGRWDDVERELAKGGSVTNTTAYGYYKAVIEGRFDDAVTKLRESGSMAGVAEAKMLEADLNLKRANSAAAKMLWAEVVAMTNVSERAFAIAAINLGDEDALRKAYRRVESEILRRRIGLRLGHVLVSSKDSLDEGCRLIKAIVSDTPDIEGAREAYVAVARAFLREKAWNEAVKAYADAIEIWTDVSRLAEVQEGRGEAFLRLGREEEALAAFIRAEELSTDDLLTARVVLRQGDVLSGLGRGPEAMVKYRLVLEKYPDTDTAITLKRLIELREREMKGRDLYKAYLFEEARVAFREVAEADPSRKPRMTFFEVLCLYGLGRDDEALELVQSLIETCEEISVRADAVLWKAKFAYNQCNWRESQLLFVGFSELRPTDRNASMALLWAARAAFADKDFVQAIQLATKIASDYPNSSVLVPALILQSEALIEQARFDEAVLVLDRVASDTSTQQEDRLKARLLRADAIFAMGADNSVRYQAALDAYRAIRNGEELTPDMKLSVSFKIGRVLEKLKRPDEAIDQYYSQVVLAYRDGRQNGVPYGDEARAVFSRAAFRLADEFEDRGRHHQAISVLRLVSESGVPAAEEAQRRIHRISMKGLFL